MQPVDASWGAGHALQAAASDDLRACGGAVRAALAPQLGLRGGRFAIVIARGGVDVPCLPINICMCVGGRC